MANSFDFFVVFFHKNFPAVFPHSHPSSQEKGLLIACLRQHNVRLHHLTLAADFHCLPDGVFGAQRIVVFDAQLSFEIVPNQNIHRIKAIHPLAKNPPTPSVTQVQVSLKMS